MARTTLYIGAEKLANAKFRSYIRAAPGISISGRGSRRFCIDESARTNSSAIQVCRELVDAEKEYYGQPHDGDSGSSVRRRNSSAILGKHNGSFTGRRLANKLQVRSVRSWLRLRMMATRKRVQKLEPFQGYYFSRS